MSYPPPLPNQRVGVLIRDNRIRRGMTQTELANRFGVGQPTVSAWEIGRLIPPTATFLRLTSILDIEPDAIRGLAAELAGAAS